MLRSVKYSLIIKKYIFL
uniref:Uncharacterized protein n=1 Tax=Anguilla anguilla TaxID=7936 RepID=A0A0E9V4N0_ANGAN